ncbi:hypothetical protein AVEN_87912-1 [Araneus ventricosus]|uniref:Major facilitator superfamily associated domain-containing protein n=1 Tax=Araneus ventricosus TaxID=182803 RepID=A0A4Y2BEP3_ARAVE|nr:hypothetical protein AVEN_87912-1 [Araneus ventricosus]
MANVGKRKAFSIGTEKHRVNVFSQNEIEHFKCCDGDVITSGEIKMDPRFNLKICNRFQIRIYKPLVILKVSLLLWYTAGGAFITYVTLFFKQRGLTLEEISLIYLTANLMQFFLNTACGVLADKVGRPVSITVFTLSFISIATVCLSFIPNVNETADCRQLLLNGKDLHCSEAKFLRFGINRTCEATYPPEICEIFCKKNRTDLQCCDHNFKHQVLQSETDGTVSLFSYLNDSHRDIKLCSSNFTKVILVGNDTHSLCDAYEKACEIYCTKYRPPHENRIKYVFLYAVVIILLLIAHENMFRFVDVLTLAMIKFHKAEYGKQRIWSAIGSLLGPSLAALVLYQTTFSEQATNYIYILYLCTILVLVTLVSVITLNVNRQEPAKKMFKAATILFKDIDFLLFIFVLLVLGATWGFQVNFKNVYLVDIGTQTYLIGIIDTFSAICGLPVLFTSKWLTDKIGNTNIFVLALLCHGLKCLGYSFLTAAWPTFLLELTSAVSFYLLWVAVMEYCAEISSDLKATVIAFAGSVHFSIGRACGSVVGGLLMSAYGGSTAFQVMAAVNVVTALFYTAYLYDKHVKKKRNLQKY